MFVCRPTSVLTFSGLSRGSGSLSPAELIRRCNCGTHREKEKLLDVHAHQHGGSQVLYKNESALLLLILSLCDLLPPQHQLFLVHHPR